jgi:hypothetical protein
MVNRKVIVRTTRKGPRHFYLDIELDE